MDAISYSRARQNLAKTLDKVCEDHQPVVITRKSGSSVVVMSLADYESLEETAYLLRSPKNAERLLGAVRRLDAGEGEVRDLSA